MALSSYKYYSSPVCAHVHMIQSVRYVCIARRCTDVRVQMCQCVLLCAEKVVSFFDNLFLLALSSFSMSRLKKQPNRVRLYACGIASVKEPYVQGGSLRANLLFSSWV